MFSKLRGAHQTLPLIVEVEMQFKYGADTNKTQDVVEAKHTSRMRLLRNAQWRDLTLR